MWVTTIPRGGKAPRKYYSVFFCNFAMLRTVMDSTNRLRTHNFETCLNFDCRSSTVNVPTFEEEVCVFESPHSRLTDSAFRATVVITFSPKATGGDAGRPLFLCGAGPRGGVRFWAGPGPAWRRLKPTTTPAARLQACAMHMPHHTRAAATRACHPWPPPPRRSVTGAGMAAAAAAEAAGVLFPV